MPDKKIITVFGATGAQGASQVFGVSVHLQNIEQELFVKNSQQRQKT